MKKLYILLAIMALLLLGGKQKRIPNQVIEIGYTYAVLDASTAAMNECFIFGDDSLRCKGATEVVKQMSWMLKDIHRSIDFEEERWP